MIDFSKIERLREKARIQKETFAAKLGLTRQAYNDLRRIYNNANEKFRDLAQEL